jgi:hypothetical protein
LRRLGVSRDELHDRAVGNLRELRLDVRAHQGARTMMLTAGGNYEATLLLRLNGNLCGVKVMRTSCPAGRERTGSVYGMPRS